MARKKLSKGKHKVRMKNCVGKMCDRYVDVASTGKWKLISKETFEKSQKRKKKK